MRMPALDRNKQKRRNLHRGRRFLKREAAMYGTGIRRRLWNQYSFFRDKVHKKVGLYFWIVKNWTKIFHQHKQGPDKCSCVMDNFTHRGAGYENSFTPTSLQICKNTSKPVIASVFEARKVKENLQSVDDIDDGGKVIQKSVDSSIASTDTFKTGNELHVIDKNVNTVSHKNVFKSVSNSEATQTSNTSETEREGFQERRNYTRAVEERPFLNDPCNICAEERTSVESAHSLRHVLSQDVYAGEVDTVNSSSIFSFNNSDTASQDSDPVMNLSDADIVSMAYLATLSVELRAFTDETYADPEMGQNTTLDNDTLHMREGYILVYEQSDILEDTDISIRDYVAPIMAIDGTPGTPSMFHMREAYILVQEESEEEYTDESIR